MRYGLLKAWCEFGVHVPVDDSDLLRPYTLIVLRQSLPLGTGDLEWKCIIFL